MSTTLTSKGQVTIPKHIREALGLEAGSRIEFEVDEQGRVVIKPTRPVAASRRKDRFESARGTATIPWRTDSLMRLLREEG